MHRRLIESINHANTFITGRLYKQLSGGEVAPYVEPLFRGDFMERMHSQFGHLTYADTQNAISETRAWWPDNMEKDSKNFITSCPNCQIMQRPGTSQDKEAAQLATDPFIQPFQRWDIDLIGVLPKTAHEGNRWTITAIES